MRSVLRRAAGRGDPCIRHRGIYLESASRTRSSATGSRCRCRRTNIRCSRRCCSAPARCCRAPSSRTGCTAGAIAIESNAVEVYIHGAAPQARQRRHPHAARRRLLRSESNDSIRTRLLIALLALVAAISLLAGTAHLPAGAGGDLDPVRLPAAPDGAVAAQPGARWRRASSCRRIRPTRIS